MQSRFLNGLIFYTLDGSPPSLSSTLYGGPITITKSTKIRLLDVSADFSHMVEVGPVELVILPTLTTGTDGGGTVSIDPPDGAYLSDSTAIVTALPSAGWSFLHWLGDASGTDPTASSSGGVSR